MTKALRVLVVGAVVVMDAVTAVASGVTVPKRPAAAGVGDAAVAVLAVATDSWG